MFIAKDNQTTCRRLLITLFSVDTIFNFSGITHFESTCLLCFPDWRWAQGKNRKEWRCLLWSIFWVCSLARWRHAGSAHTRKSSWGPSSSTTIRSETGFNWFLVHFSTYLNRHNEAYVWWLWYCLPVCPDVNIIFHYLATQNSSNLPKKYKFCQSMFKIVPNTK